MSDEVQTYLNDLLITNCDIHKRRTCYSSSNFICPRIKHETEGGRTFTVNRIRAWNSPSLAIRQSESRKCLKNGLIKIALDDQLELEFRFF